MSEKPKKPKTNNWLQFIFAFLFGIGLAGLILLLNKRPTPEMIQILPTLTKSPMVVYITGEVVNPGVYELGQPSRIIDLVNLAGGFTPDANDININLASLLYDGQQVFVPSLKDDSETPTSPQSESDNEIIYSININHCTLEELMSLPGIGETKAAAVIAYREENGEFEVIEDILNVSGIGDTIFNSIKDMITVK